ncbi:MAG: hypothetical protein MI757_10970 [Pirellulales bacterium]|nr:hypothetical protein [Pirellulales bacterium]
MAAFKRLVLVFWFLIGLVGLVACGAAIYGTWYVRQQVEDTVVVAFDTADQTLERVEGLAQQTNQRVAGVRTSLEFLDEQVRLRVAERRKVSPKEAAGIDEIERQLYAHIQHIANLIDFMRSSVDLVEQLLAMAESTAAFLQTDTRSARDVVVALRAGHEEIEQASAIADDVREALVEVRASRNIEQNAERIRTLSSRIDGSLTKIAGYGDQFEQGIGNLRKDTSDFGERIRERLLVLAIALTVFLAWMALGQLCMMRQSCCG